MASLDAEERAYIENIRSQRFGPGLAIPVFGPNGRNGYYAAGIGTNKSAEEVFDQSQSLVFKQLAVRRIYDASSDSLMYVSFSRTIVDGSAKMSLSTVPLYGQEVTWTGAKPAAE